MGLWSVVCGGECEPLFVGGDGDVELVEKSRESEEPECWCPWFAEPDWRAPLVRVLLAGDLQADDRHASSDGCASNCELSLDGFGDIDSAEFGYVSTKADRSGSGVE